MKTGTLVASILVHPDYPVKTIMNRPYNGHPSYNAWNVALWIANDEGLYNLALDCVRECGSVAMAARQFVDCLRDAGCVETPDGVSWTVTNVRRALSGLE